MRFQKPPKNRYIETNFLLLFIHILYANNAFTSDFTFTNLFQFYFAEFMSQSWKKKLFLLHSSGFIIIMLGTIFNPSERYAFEYLFEK